MSGLSPHENLRSSSWELCYPPRQARVKPASVLGRGQDADRFYWILDARSIGTMFSSTCETLRARARRVVS